eukprot:350885-Chlamydomonas_euryale.AAC.3
MQGCAAECTILLPYPPTVHTHTHRPYPVPYRTPQQYVLAVPCNPAFNGVPQGIYRPCTDPAW